MTSLLLTLSPDEPLVIGDADAVVNIVQTRGRHVRVRVDSNENVKINRGSIYLGKKLLPDYVSTPLIDLWKENPDLMGELLDQADNNLYLTDFDYDSLPEKTKRIFDMISPRLYVKVIELFLAKFLYVNNLEFNEASVELFNRDFLKGENL